MDEQSYSNRAVHSQYPDDDTSYPNILDHIQMHHEGPTSEQLKRLDSYKFGFVMTDFSDLLLNKIRNFKETSFRILKQQFGPDKYYYQYPSDNEKIIQDSCQPIFNLFQLDLKPDSSEQKQERPTINWYTAKILFNQFARRINFVKKMHLQAAFDNIQIRSLCIRRQPDQIEVQLSVSDSQNPSFYVEQASQSQFDFEYHNNQIIEFQRIIDQQNQQWKRSHYVEPFTPRSPPMSMKSRHKRRKNRQKLTQKIQSSCISNMIQTQSDESFCLSDQQSSLYSFDLQSLFNTCHKQKIQPTTETLCRTQSFFINQQTDCSNLSPSFSCFGRGNFTPRAANRRTQSSRLQNQVNFRVIPKQEDNQDRKSLRQNMAIQQPSNKQKGDKASIFMMDDELFFTH